MPNDTEGNVLFPIFLKLHQLNLLLVGGGAVGLEKLQAILKNCPEARVTIVAKELLAEGIIKLTESHANVVLYERPFQSSDLENQHLVILASDDRQLHEYIKGLTASKYLLTNVADTPELCDFYLGSVVKKGDLKIAISSNGKSPTLTKRIREYLEEAIPQETQEVLDNLESIRAQLKGDFEEKVKILNEVTSSWTSSGDKQ